jgi:hypothetical protein
MSLKVDFYCDEKYHDLIPEPVEAAKSFPKWFSEMPFPETKNFAIDNDNIYSLTYDKRNTNLKKCVGVTEFLKSGYLVPSWADFVFRELDDGNLFVNWVENYFDEIKYDIHFDSQYPTLPNKPIYGHFGKIMTPWTIKTSKGVSCLITHPVWHNNKSFTSATGIFHTDAAPLRLAWFFEWNYKIKTKMDVENIDIENQVVGKGEPIISIIPFYRKKYSHTVNYLSKEKMRTINYAHHNLTHDSINSKCPYIKFRRELGKLF